MNPHAATSPVAGPRGADLSRVPRAPRTPSRNARLVVVNVAFTQAFLLVLGSTLSILGTLGFLRQCAERPMAQINLVPLILPVGGFFMVVVGVAGYRRRRRTFTHGTPVLGSIVSFGPDPRASSETRDGRRPTVLAWAFDAAGGRFGGSVSSFDPSLLGERRVGDAIVVLFDPKNPAVNTLWLE